MARAANGDAATLQHELLAYLRERDRAGDAERIAQRLARAHSRGRRVVGFRRRGNEVLLRQERSGEEGTVLGIYEVGLTGHLDRAGTIRVRCGLERWLERHRYFLEWIRPDLRPDRERGGSELETVGEPPR